MPRWLTDYEHEALTSALDAVLPGDGSHPGAGTSGGADYVDQLLACFTFDPPRIWAGGPFSGRAGGQAGFDAWLRPGTVEEIAWRIRVEGSRGDPRREFNGPVTGWQERYRSGLAALGPDFCRLEPGEQRRRIGTDPDFLSLLFEHACEAQYGDPVYGGNAGGAGWEAIDFDGDTQPRGWTPEEVTYPEGASGVADPAPK